MFNPNGIVPYCGTDRKICYWVKGCNDDGEVNRSRLLRERRQEWAFQKMAMALSSFVKPNSLIVPMCGHEGCGTYMCQVANILADVKDGFARDMLSCEPHPSLCSMKKKGEVNRSWTLVLPEFRFNIKGNEDVLEKASGIVIIDNVIDSGVTMSRAIDAVKRAGLNATGLAYCYTVRGKRNK